MSPKKYLHVKKNEKWASQKIRYGNYGNLFLIVDDLVAYLSSVDALPDKLFSR
jgi:hypothetical protein